MADIEISTKGLQQVRKAEYVINGCQSFNGYFMLYFVTRLIQNNEEDRQSEKVSSAKASAITDRTSINEVADSNAG